MKSSKVKEKSVFQSWSDVDQGLKRAGEIEIKIKQIVAEHDELRKKIDERELAKCDPLNQELLILENNMKIFAEQHRDDLTGKEKVLTFGKVFFRLTGKSLKLVKGNTWDKVVDVLKQLELTKYIDFKPQVKKNELKKADLTDYQLSRLGLQITQQEEFYYETNNAKK